MFKVINYLSNQKSQPVVYGLAVITLFSLLIIYLNFFQPSTVVFLLFLLTGAVLIFAEPSAGIIALTIITMTLERWFGLQPLNLFGLDLKIYLLDFVLIITWLAAFFRTKPRALRSYKKVGKLLVFWTLIISIWCFLSWLWGGDKFLIASAFKNLVFYPISIVTLTLLYCQNNKNWLQIFKSILVGGLLITIFILLGLISGRGLWSEFTPLSTAGSRLLAATHAFFIIFPLYLLLTIRSDGKRVFNFRNGSWDLIVFFLWLVGLIVSLFRNVWLGVFGGVVAIYYFLKGSERVRFVKNFLNIFLLGFFSLIIFVWLSYLITGDNSVATPYLESIQERVGALNPTSLKDSSARFRLAAWQEAREKLSLHPFFGIGFGRNIQFSLDDSDYQVDVRELHNDYLAMLLQLGLVGALALFGTLFLLVREAYLIASRSVGKYRPYLIASLAWLFTYLILSALGTYWETNFYIIFFWLVLGLVYSAKKLKEKND